MLSTMLRIQRCQGPYSGELDTNYIKQCNKYYSRGILNSTRAQKNNEFCEGWAME